MRYCKRCGKIFDQGTKYQKYCMECSKPKGFLKGGERNDKKICPTCGKEFIIGEYNRKYCGKECYHERN